MHGTLPTLTKFLSAEALDLTEPQREALIAVLGMLERGELRHVKHVNPLNEYNDGDPPIFSGHFNMENWAAPGSCGTVCCIGGTAALIANDINLFPIVWSNRGLRDLFLPYEVGDNWSTITPTQAARALRSYLTMGEANWKEAVS